MKTIKLLIIIPVFIGLVSCGGKKEEKQTELLRPVKYSQVIQVGGSFERTFTGISKSANEANLSFRSSGLLISFPIKAGQKVNRGQLLGSLDDKDAQLAYQQAKASLENNRVQLKNTESNLRRIKDLYLANNATLSDYEQAKSQYASAKANYESAEKSLELKQSQLEYLKIYAPADGTVAVTNVKENEVVQAGSPVVVLYFGDELEVEAGVAESYISMLSKDDPVNIRFTAKENMVFDGEITEIGLAKTGAGVYPVTVTVMNITSDIRAGMPAEVTFSFTAGSGEPRLVVPPSAVNQDSNGNFVYKLNPQDSVYVVAKQIVQIGQLYPEGFEIISGLNEGEFVATAGLSTLYDGKRVSLLTDKIN